MQQAQRQAGKRRSAVIAAVAGTALVVGIAVTSAVKFLPHPTSRPTQAQIDSKGAPAAARSNLRARALATALLVDDTQLKQIVQNPTSAPAALRRRSPVAGRRSEPGATPAIGRAPTTPVPRGAPAPQPTASPSPVYLNPLRSVTGLVPERVDMGVDFGGAGPVYALGSGVITSATADSPGWPGGGWITYQLTSGPAAGLMVYVAEDVTPTVQVGQQVTSSTVIANMYNAGDGIETGWAMADGASAESESPAAGGIDGYGPFPTLIGLNFEALLQALGVPAAPNADQLGSGILPPGYPTTWTDITA